MVTLKDILGKDEMTYYEAGRLIEQVGAAMKELPNAVIRPAGDAIEEGKKIIVKWKELGSEILRVQNEIDKAEEVLGDRWDQLYKNVQKRRIELAKKFKELPDLPELRLPRNFEELVKTVQSFAHLSEEQWSRIVDLARAFSGQVR